MASNGLLRGKLVNSMCTYSLNITVLCMFSLLIHSTLLYYPHTTVILSIYYPHTTLYYQFTNYIQLSLCTISWLATEKLLGKIGGSNAHLFTDFY